MVKGKSTQGLDCTLLKNGVFTIIYEWEKAKKGDCFYMERLGDEGRGIVFRGQFTSDPYLSVRTGLGPARSAITSTLTVSMPLLLMGNPTSLWKN